jgi:hypothetical protein
MKTNTLWSTVDDVGNKKTPAWQRSACITDDGVVFAPAAIFGNEERIYFMAAFDGVSYIYQDSHVYLPTSWLETNIKNGNELAKLIDKRMKSIQIEQDK